MACGIFLDQGLNPCPLSWQENSWPLSHQEAPGLLLGLPRGLRGKDPPAMQETLETRVWPLVQEDPLQEEMATHSGILVWEVGRRSLAGYSPWGRKESDTTEWPSTHARPRQLWPHSQGVLVLKTLPASIRDSGLIPGSGWSPGGPSNPLQHSCLESPMDRGAWRARAHEVAKSRTRLKWLNVHAVC